MKKSFLFYIAVIVALVVGLPGWLQPEAGSHASGQDAQPPAAAQTGALTPGAADGRTAVLRTEHFEAHVSSVHTGLSSFRLQAPEYRIEGRPIDIVTTDKARYFPLAPELEGLTLGDDARWSMQQLSERAVRFRLEADDLIVERKIEAGRAPYQLWITTSLENRGQAARKLRLHETTHHYVRREDESGGVPILPARSSAISHGLCRHGTELERLDRGDLRGGREWTSGVRFSGIESVYFLNALIAPDGNAQACRVQSEDRFRPGETDADGSLFSARLSHAETTLAPGEKQMLRSMAYLGPKTPEELATVGRSLPETIDTGFFSSLANALTALMSMIHGVVGNWGVAIILLTFLVKLALYPLTHKQMESMAKMKELKPEMDRINELYADDREKKGAAIMELYRKRGVNPMAGCFPVLLQLPIWFSLYASLSSNIRLFHAPFMLWWQDLSSPDPYFVLPLSLGALMFVQQKMAPPAGVDPLQAKMMLYMMPTMITAFMLFLPAGLGLYMFTNSALSIVQQRFIEARLRKAAQANPSPSTPPPAASPDASASPGAAKPKTPPTEVVPWSKVGNPPSSMELCSSTVSPTPSTTTSSRHGASAPKARARGAKKTARPSSRSRCSRRSSSA